MIKITPIFFGEMGSKSPDHCSQSFFKHHLLREFFPITMFSSCPPTRHALSFPSHHFIFSLFIACLPY